MASVKSTDPQRLIAVSLGKIHAARGQRGGVNLHKNLLVAGVIMKARSIYIMGLNNKDSGSSSEPESEEEDIEDEEEEEEQEVEAPIEDTTDGLSAPVCAPTTHEADAEAEQLQQQKPEPEVLDLSCIDCDKENSPPEERTNNTDVPTSCPPSEKSVLSTTSPQKEAELVNDSSSSSCQRCTKRRLAEDSDVSNNASGAKRQRISSPSSSSELCQSTADSSTQCEPEPMQTDSAQISNLVHRFNSGLTGFLSCNTNIQQDNNSTDNSTTELHQKDSHSVSCSSQIKEAFETLARPVALALSV